MILCDDDVLGENCIKSFYDNYEAVTKSGSKLVRFASMEIDENSHKTLGLFKHPNLESAGNSYCRKLFGASRSSLSEFIFKRNEYLKYGFKNYPLAWGADNRAWLDFSDDQMIFTINTATVYFRLSNVNISRKNFQDDLKWEARRLFFIDLFNDHLNKFSSQQKIKLSLYYEGYLKKVGVSTPIEILTIFKTLFLNGAIWESVKFIRRIFMSKQ